MARGSDKYEQEFINTAKEKTGRDVGEWMAVIRESGIGQKQNTILKWLKETHGFNHLQANLMAGLYLNDGKPVYDYPVLWNRLFEEKAQSLEWFREIERRVMLALPDVEFIPTKAYVSVEGKKIFACVTPLKDSLRVGLDLGDAPMEGAVQKARGLGAMPNLTHMVEVKEYGDINGALVGYFEAAYRKVHGA